MDGYKRFNVTIGGQTLIMHNGQTADPLNKYAKAMKAVSGIRKKTDADFEKLAQIEYEAGLYLDAEQNVVVPGRVFEAVVVEGAKVQKDGKLALAGVFVDNDAVLEYEGGPLTVAQLLKSDAHRLAVPVRVGQSRVIRTRPLFRNWRATFDTSLNVDVANERQLKLWVEKAGAFKGLCDWRPRHGRFELLDFLAR